MAEDVGAGVAPGRGRPTTERRRPRSGRGARHAPGPPAQTAAPTPEWVKRPWISKSPLFDADEEPSRSVAGSESHVAQRIRGLLRPSLLGDGACLGLRLRLRLLLQRLLLS